MLAPFFIIVFATLGSLVGADWIRHRDQSIVASFGGLISATRESASKGVQHATARTMAIGRVIAGVSAVVIVLAFVAAHFVA